MPLASRHTGHDLVTGIAAGHKPELRRAYMTLPDRALYSKYERAHDASTDGIEMPGRLLTCLARCAARIINNNKVKKRRKRGEKKKEKNSNTSNKDKRTNTFPNGQEKKPWLYVRCDATLQRTSAYSSPATHFPKTGNTVQLCILGVFGVLAGEWVVYIESVLWVFLRGPDRPFSDISGRAAIGS